MNIAGFQKLTLIDYPGRIATTVFTVGCNFRCPFCHNPELVECGALGAKGGRQEKEFFDFLKTRKGKLEGICITGGEPTVQPDLIDFIKKVKKMEFLVKLDTNGTRPDILKKVIDEKLVDFIAMDIKNQAKRYQETAVTKLDLSRIILSVEVIMNSRIPYEFRTTAVPGIHTQKDFLEIAKWIRGADAYYLQKYRELRVLDPKLKNMTKGRSIDLERVKRKIGHNFQKIGVRD